MLSRKSTYCADNTIHNQTSISATVHYTKYVYSYEQKIHKEIE